MDCEICGRKSDTRICIECEVLGNRKPRFKFSKKDRLPKHYKIFLANLDSLIRLCHPDRHDNSARSTEVTKWLLEVKRESRKGVTEKKDILEGEGRGRWNKRSGKTGSAR